MESTIVVQKSWVEVSPDSHFTIYTIPFGIVEYQNKTIVATIIGDTVISLPLLNELELLDKKYDTSIFENKYLNDFINLGKNITSTIRKTIIDLLIDTTKSEKETIKKSFIPLPQVKNLLPIQIGNYTDFYASKEHATNVGSMFRDPTNALLPNWKHIPIGYHGRASSIVVSGTPIQRPNGQFKPVTEPNPIFGASRQLDFELEIALILGKNTDLGEIVTITQAEDYMYGMAIFNDWSARDIQAWEYQPLGPFLGKNFGSSLSSWIVPMEALQPFYTPAPVQDVEVLPYLQQENRQNIDMHLEVAIASDTFEPHTICRSNHKYLYWTPAQQVAHHTINGCNISIGDVYASGTISGTTPDSYGSMLELAWKGTKPLPMPDGSTRTFLQDGDTVIMKAFCEKNGMKVGFGELTGKVIPARVI